MTDLPAWLLEQIATDEALALDAARAAEGKRWETPTGEYNTVRVHVADAPDADPTYDDGDGWYPPLVYDEGACPELAARHIAAWDPQRVLAECAAKRAIVRLWGGANFALDCHPDDEGEQGHVNGIGKCLALVASAYADRPGYRQEWAP